MEREEEDVEGDGQIERGTEEEEMVPNNSNSMGLVERYSLPNKLEVLLIAGSSKLTSSVNFGLDLGSFFDPGEYLGFSKILSCLSQYIPTEENKFMRLMDSIHKKGRSCITYYWIPQTSETTIESSGVFSSECLDDYLGRIRRSLEVVEYPGEIVSKCLARLRSEYENDIYSGAVHGKTVLRSVLDLGLRGSLVTDEKHEISGLLAEIKRYKEKYYSSNVMKLVIESSLSFEYLIRLVSKHFSTIHNFEIDIRRMRHSLGLENLRPENLVGRIVEYRGAENRTSFIFVLDSENGSLLGSRRVPLFEYFVKHYFCGEFSGSLRNAVYPLVLTCNVEYYVERFAFIWLEVESEGENIAMRETLELIYSSMVLLRKTGVEQDYLDFLRNHCIANYMNYDLMDYKISIQDRIDALVNYNVWHKLDRYCSGGGTALKEFNHILTFLTVENLLILVNSNQVGYLVGGYDYDYEYEDCLSCNEDYLESGPEGAESNHTSSITFSSGSGGDDSPSRVFRNRTLDHGQEEDGHGYRFLEPFLKIDYNVRRIPQRLLERLRRLKESLCLINGISRPFINVYTPKSFRLVNFVWEGPPKVQVVASCLEAVMRSESDCLVESNPKMTYLTGHILSGIGGAFLSKMAIGGSESEAIRYFDTQISLVKNVNIWYKARNDKRSPYFRGVLRLSLASRSFKIANFILSCILIISLRSMFNFQLTQDAKLSLSLSSGPEHSSVYPSIDFQIGGYSSSLYPLLTSISSALSSEEVISESHFSDPILAYRKQLMSRKRSMTSKLKARELSWRLTTPDYPGLGKQFLGLDQVVTRQKLSGMLKRFKESLCIDGLFVGNLDRIELEDSLKSFSSRLGSKATKKQCTRTLNRRSFPIKDVRGTKYRKLVYHYVRPGPFNFSGSCNSASSAVGHKASRRFNSRASIENLFKYLNEECGPIKGTNETIRSGYLDYSSSSNEFGPNIALLDIIVYGGGSQGGGSSDGDDAVTGILYLNDAYYNIMWFRESLNATKASLSLKTSVEKFDGYHKWSIQLESWEYSANDLGLYISHLTSIYQSNLRKDFGGENFDLVKKLTVSKLKNRLVKTGIDEEFSSHRFNLGYSEYVTEELGRLDSCSFMGRMSNILRDHSLFLLIQVQSTSLNGELSLAPQLRGLRSKNDMVSIPVGYKRIKHIDELVQDDRIPTYPLDLNDDVYH